MWIARTGSRRPTHIPISGRWRQSNRSRPKIVLNIMDGLSGVWQAGPFSEYPQFRFYPKQIMFGTDPVAMDRIVIDAIEAKRKAEGAPSIFDRSPSHLGKITAIRSSMPSFANPDMSSMLRGWDWECTT